MLLCTLGWVCAHRADGTEVELGGVLERRVLSALAVKGGQLASLDALVEAVFGEEGSTNAAIRLQNHVSRLRKRLGASTIVTVAQGYRLDTDVVVLDWLRFEGLLTVASGTADRAAAALALEEALSLWHGAPFSDVDEWEPARAQAAFDEADRIARAIDSHGLRGVLLRHRFTSLVDHDPPAAASATVELLSSSRKQLDFVFASVGLAHATILLAAVGDASNAARLVGKVDQPLMSQVDTDRYPRANEELRVQLGERADHLTAQGAAAGFFDFIDLACSSLAAAYPANGGLPAAGT